MANMVVGSFSNEEELRNAIQDLEKKGYSEENIIVLMNKKNSKEMESKTDIQVESVDSNERDNEGFMDKIKRALAQDVGPEDTLSAYDRLLSHGLSEEQAKEYSGSLEAGNMVLIANEDNASTGRRTAPLADDNIDSLDRTGRTNVAEDDVATSSAYQNITADDREPEREEGSSSADEREEEVLEENPVLNKSTQERDGRSI